VKIIYNEPKKNTIYHSYLFLDEVKLGMRMSQVGQKFQCSIR